jgi:hypothetical protein
MQERTVFNAAEEPTVFLLERLRDNLVVLRVLSTESAQQQQATLAAEESLRIFQKPLCRRRRYLSTGGDFANHVARKRTE